MTFEGKKHLILDPDTIVKHLWFTGGTGCGKSTFARNIIHALRSSDSVNPALIYVDPKGRDSLSLMQELSDFNDVVFLDPTRGFALNPLELPPSTSANREQLVSLYVGHFEELMGSWAGRSDLQSYAPRMTWLFEHSLRYLYSELDAPTMSDINSVVNAYRSKNTDVITAIEKRFSRLGEEGLELAEALRSFEALPSDAWMPLMTRISRFSTDPFLKKIFCARHSTVDLSKRLDRGQLTVVRCAGLGGRILGFFLAGIVLGLWFRTKYRTEIEGKENLALLIGDELNVISNAVHSFEEILSKSRAFGLGVFNLNQNIAQLPKNVRESLGANCATQIVSKASGTDADYFLRNWGISSYQAEYKSAMTRSEYWRPYTAVIKDVDGEIYELDLPEPPEKRWNEEEVNTFIDTQEIRDGHPATPFTRKLVEGGYEWGRLIGVAFPSEVEWKLLSTTVKGKNFYSTCKDAPLPRDAKIKKVWKSLIDAGDLIVARTKKGVKHYKPSKSWFDVSFSPDFSRVAKSQEGQEISKRALEEHLSNGDFCGVVRQVVGEEAPDLFSYNYENREAVSIEVESSSEIIHHAEQVRINMEEFRSSDFDRLEVWFPVSEKGRMRELVADGDDIILKGVDLNAD